MKKFKKAALTAASYVSVAALAIGGTVAYLSSTDSDTNVMTLGNVKIEQHEYQRAVDANGKYEVTEITDNGTTYDSYVLEDFEQGKELLPIVGDPSLGEAGWDSTPVRMSQVDSYGGMQVFAGKNAQDKFVTVENTGKSDAYVRTLVAIEVGDASADLIGTSYHTTWAENTTGIFEINGKKYSLTEYIYEGAKLSDGSWRHEDGILPGGDTTYPSLSQVYISSTATNEDMEALDGNGNGVLDILVLSQASQIGGESAKDMLDSAFGEVNADNVAKWFADMKGVEASPESGAVRPAGYNPVDEGTKVINGLTVIDNSDEATNLRALYTGDGKKLSGDFSVDNSYLDGTYAMNVIGDDTGKLSVSDTTLKGWVSYDGFTSAEFDNCTFTQNTNAEFYKTIRPYSEIVISNSSFEEDYEFWLDKLPDGAKITLDNCTLNGAAITDASQLKIPHGSADSVVIK